MSAQNITIVRGDDRNYQIAIKDSSNVAIDITDCVVFFTVKKIPTTSHPTDDNAVIKKVISVHDDAVNGLTSVYLSKVDTKIDPRDYAYDVQYKDADDNITSSGVGVFTVTPEVTEAES